MSRFTFSFFFFPCNLITYNPSLIKGVPLWNTYREDEKIRLQTGMKHLQIPYLTKLFYLEYVENSQNLSLKKIELENQKKICVFILPKMKYGWQINTRKYCHLLLVIWKLKSMWNIIEHLFKYLIFFNVTKPNADEKMENLYHSCISSNNTKWYRRL